MLRVFIRDLDLLDEVAAIATCPRCQTANPIRWLVSGDLERINNPTFHCSHLSSVVSTGACSIEVLFA